jgi:hypothetical protein
MVKSPNYWETDTCKYIVVEAAKVKSPITEKPIKVNR